MAIGVCIETFFSDLPYRERIRKVKELGFSTYEFWFHDKRFDGKGLIDEPKDFDEIAGLNRELGLTTTDFVFNHPDGGVVGALIDAGDRSLILDSLEEMLGLARKIGCKAFISGSGNKRTGLRREQAIENMVETLGAAAKICARDGVTLILEPFNSKVDHPDYFLDDPATCVQVLEAVDHPNAKMLFDIYHMQIMSGNILAFVRENLRHIAHFHIAGVPGRHEPEASELNYPFIIREILEMGYQGNFGLEYWPTVDSAESLRRTQRYLEG
ncbi:MAG: TIM barrel protein [Spirochaetales bacterium]|nr:TIM barrel protein [Spirochaetales bacterium]